MMNIYTQSVPKSSDVLLDLYVFLYKNLSLTSLTIINNLSKKVYCHFTLGNTLITNFVRCMYIYYCVTDAIIWHTSECIVQLAFDVIARENIPTARKIA